MRVKTGDFYTMDAGTWNATQSPNPVYPKMSPQRNPSFYKATTQSMISTTHLQGPQVVQE